jgi:5-methylcytosine-specific restriction endonuclease McrA
VSEEWKGTKRQKDTLRAKFGGRCAYCGCMLDKMQADHLEPVTRVPACTWSNPPREARMLNPELNVVSNMMPACPACNNHKGGYSLEGWRDIIQRSAQIARRATATFKAGERFGIITVSEQPVRFYFETLLDQEKAA